MTTLKPCPFCGMQDDELAIEYIQAYADDNSVQFRVVCSSGHKGSLRITKELAVEDWNTRREPKVRE